jgi:hypothetical protein
MKVKYLAEDWWKPEITKTQIQKETEKSYWDHRGNRGLKVSSNKVLFDTFEEAKSWLLERCELRVKQARTRLDDVKGQLGNVKGMKP